MKNLLMCEQLKLKRSYLVAIVILIPTIINTMLKFDLNYRYTGYLLKNQVEMNLTFWQMVFKEQSILYFTTLLPVIISIILNHFFYLEYKNNGWVTVLTKPVKLFDIIISKYVLSMKYISILLIFNSLTLIIAGLMTDGHQKIDFHLFIKCYIVMFFSSMAINCFCLLFIVIFKNRKISIFLTLIIAILSQNTYGKNIFSLFNIYSFAEYSYRATNTQMLNMTINSCLLVAIILSILYFNKNKISDLIN